jgi:hypothetical protein
MADETIAHKDDRNFGTVYAGLASVPMLVITSNDGLAPMNDALVAAVRAEIRTSPPRTSPRTIRIPTSASHSKAR